MSSKVRDNCRIVKRAPSSVSSDSSQSLRLVDTNSGGSRRAKHRSERRPRHSRFSDDVKPPVNSDFDDQWLVDKGLVDEQPEDQRMEESATAEGGSVEGELFVRETPEPVAPVADSSHDMPPDIGSRWLHNPNASDILRLARCSGVDSAVVTPEDEPLTVKDVITNAVASVEFLRTVTQPAINLNDIGIDYAGRLFNISPYYHRDNFRGEFSEMVSALKKNSDLTSIKKKVTECLERYVAISDDYFFDAAAQVSLSLLEGSIRTVVSNPSWGVEEVESILAECRKARKELDRHISLVTTVKHDLSDSRSTTLKRWSELKTLSKGLKQFIDATDLTNPEGVDEAIEEICHQLEPLRMFLGLILRLEEDLDNALPSIRSAQRRI